jgi:DNA-binding NarL/FixJ family response regulator
MSGIACTASLKATLPSVPVMMLTVYEDTDAIFNALKAGASGYLLKRSDPAKVLDRVGCRGLRSGTLPHHRTCVSRIRRLNRVALLQGSGQV